MKTCLSVSHHYDITCYCHFLEVYYQNKLHYSYKLITIVPAYLQPVINGAVLYPKSV